MLLDTHFHLDFCTELFEPSGFQVVAQTVLPSSFVPGPLRSLGYHPWWVSASLDRELALFDAHLPTTRFIGEIGLDFSPRRLENKELQVRAFQHIVSRLSEDHVMSIHAVRAASDVLDLLEGCPATPVFHWFSGNSDELTRLMKRGGYISVNPRMLESKRGRAFVKQVPADRLLLETDLPSEPGPCDPAVVASALQDVVNQLSELRKCDMGPIIQENSERLYFS